MESYQNKHFDFSIIILFNSTYSCVFKGINILGSTQGTRAELEQGLYWMSQGKIKSIIDSVYPLERAAEAHTKMLKGKGLFGKILMKPGSD